MANEEHLNVLMQGVEAWNRWREENLGGRPDLSNVHLLEAALRGAHLRGAYFGRAELCLSNFFGADLREADLSGANLFGVDLRWADLREAVFSEASLRGAYLSGADLGKANLSKANLNGANLDGANLSEANLGGANLGGADLRGANLHEANLHEADLGEANLGGAHLDGVDLGKADLGGADLRETDFSDADLREADLREAHLNEANLNWADLGGADLHGADLHGANLSGANLRGANLSGASLTWVSLSGTNLRGADLSRARVGYTRFDDFDLSAVKGLDTVEHLGPSTIGVDTLYKSHGQIPEAFLRGCGLSDWEIEAARLYQPDLSRDKIGDIVYKIHDLRAHQAIQVNSLFISYSHANAPFVNCLEGYLTRKGIRFWRDVHDATAGRLEKQIDRAMRLNPTVLLVLSAQSVRSDWVEHEARLARKLEKELGRDVLCPVALDDAWKTCHWPERLREQIMEYNILDFSAWQDEAFFRRAAARLIDGLDLFYKGE